MSTASEETRSRKESLRIGEEVDGREQVTLPTVEILTGRGFVTGKSGSGKSNSAGVIAEELLDRDLPLMIVDTDGEYYGLKEEYDILHVGATDECDKSVTSDHAPKLAELGLEDNVPIILDLSGFIDEEEADALLRETARELFKREGEMKKPFLLLVEEIHEYIPESGGIDETGEMLIRVAKRGRKRGLGITGMSQRPADVKKDFITQCDWLLWHRLTWKNDTDVLGTLLDREYCKLVQELGDGEGFLMADFIEAQVQRIQVKRKSTFDAGATPDLGSFDDNGDSDSTKRVSDQNAESRSLGADALDEYDIVVGGDTEDVSADTAAAEQQEDDGVPRTELFDDSSLLARFTNVEEAMPDRVVAKMGSEKFHRQALDSDEVEPGCRSTQDLDWEYVELKEARLAGLEPCTNCFKSVLQHLAADPETDVELRSGENIEDLDADPDGDLFEPEPLPERPKLSSVTETVMVPGGNQKTMHAPTCSGTLCGERGRYREVSRQAVEGHYEPCKRCFDVDELSDE